MIKNYKFEWLSRYECEFEVDDRFTEEIAQETLDFFSWYYDEEANPIDVVLRKYALEAFRLATRYFDGASGVIDSFKTEAEGFGVIDGSIGIKLLRVDCLEFEDCEYDLELIED